MGTVVLSRSGNKLHKLNGSRFLDYNIGRVEFCHKPLESKSIFRIFLDWILGGGELPTRDEMVRGLLREAPSLHHRFIHFRATAPSNDDYVFGTMEFTSDGAVCTVYHTDDLPYGSQVHGEYRSVETSPLSIQDLFQRAWKGRYRLLDNNCIDYAIRCWNLLEPRNYVNGDRIVITYNDVYLAA